LRAAVQSHLHWMRRGATAAALSGIFWFAVWASIRWWLMPEQSPLLRFQGLLGVLALVISIGVIAGIERDRRMFAQLLARDRTGKDADVGPDQPSNPDESVA